MADKVVPGKSTTRGDIPVHRTPGGTQGGMEIDPNDLRRFNEGQDAWPEGVNTTPKAPRTDPETYNYKVKRSSAD